MTKDNGTQSIAEWAAENMTHVVVYGNYQYGAPIEYVTKEPTTIEDAEKLAKNKRASGWDFAYTTNLADLHA